MVAGALLAAAIPAAAQEKPVAFSVGAIIVGPLSDSGRQFTPGLGVDVGADWHLTEQAGLRFDFAATMLGTRDAPSYPASVPVDVTPRMQFGTANFFFRSPPDKIRIFVTGGGGLYHRTVGLSTSASGPITICNPWWFVCYPTPVAAAQVNGTRSSTDFGMNAGAGIGAGRFFAEMRYHFVWGPTYTLPKGETPASGKFLTMVIGVRF